MMSVTFTSDNDAEGVNLANRNALLALVVMGLAADELVGLLPADQFYTATLQLLTLNDDGIDDVVVSGAPHIIDCGLRADYWLDLANRFMSLADGASEVAWS